MAFENTMHPVPAVAADVMHRAVVAVGPDTTLDQAIKLMTRNRISGLPVVAADGALAGILTEGDLLRRVETGTQGTPPGWFSSTFRPGALAADYVHTHGRRVGELMSIDVISVAEDTPLADVVALMTRHHVKRLPVLRDGRLVGIVSRSDLMAKVGEALAAPNLLADDEVVRQAILADMGGQPWSPGISVEVGVKDGVVQLDGCLFDMRAREALQVVAENTPGVREVQNNIVCIEPYSGMILLDPGADKAA
jgi:CBS domain-containing protein